MIVFWWGLEFFVVCFGWGFVLVFVLFVFLGFVFFLIAVISLKIVKNGSQICNLLSG